MTREEALSTVKNLVALLGDDGLEWERRCGLVLTRFVELGMLKIEEPKTAWDEFVAGMRERMYLENSCVWPDIAAVMQRAGLKVVRA